MSNGKRRDGLLIALGKILIIVAEVGHLTPMLSIEVAVGVIHLGLRPVHDQIIGAKLRILESSSVHGLPTILGGDWVDGVKLAWFASEKRVGTELAL